MKAFESTAGSGRTGSRKRDKELKLIRRAQQGDKDAIGELYRQHVDVIYRYIWARVRDENTAEDLTALVFLKALEALPNYKPTGKPFLAWLYSIAYARIVDHWRKQERRVEVPLEETLPAREPRPGELLEVQDDWATAVDLLAQLTDDQQDVIILRFIGQMSLAEVAEAVGKTVGATKQVQYRALASLARLMEGQGGSQST
jgi:RNA polymerase sigma-70 factor (ECF subfamily)